MLLSMVSLATGICAAWRFRVQELEAVNAFRGFAAEFETQAVGGQRVGADVVCAAVDEAGELCPTVFEAAARGGEEEGAVLQRDGVVGEVAVYALQAFG